MTGGPPPPRPAGGRDGEGLASRRRLECRRLCAALLGRPPSPELEEDFLRAYEIFPALAASEEGMGRLLQPPLDLEALEIALRRRSPSNPLTRRFQLVSYLAEVRPANLDLYTNDSPRPLRGLLVLAAHVPRTLWKALRGRLLLGRADGL